MIELADAIDLGDVPTAIDREHHELVALDLVLAHDRLAAAGGRVPIDPAHVVAVGVVAQRLEVGALAADARLSNPDLTEPPC